MTEADQRSRGSLRLLECVVGFFVLPPCLYLVRHQLAFRLLPFVILLAVGCGLYLVRTEGVDRRSLCSPADIRRHLRGILALFPPAALLIAALTALYLRPRFLALPLHAPWSWIAVMLLYPVLAAIQDVATKSVRLNADFSWRMEPGYAANLFFMANPNAPTGIQYPRETVNAFCRNFPGVVLVDEAYVDFADYDCASLALSLPNVLVARTLSKSSSLAGLRLGYALGSASLIEALYKIKDSYNLDRLTQELGRAAIEDSEHLRRNAEKIKATRARTVAALVHLGFTVLPSATNFLFIKPPRLSAAEVFAALRARKILVRYFPGELTGEYLRVTIGTDAEMDQFLAVLREILA